MPTETAGPAPELVILPDPEAVSRAAAERIVALAQEETLSRGRDAFAVALAGGSTPRRLYGMLAAAPFAERIPWKALHIFWGDERAVPPDDPGSNYRMARETLLDHVPIPPENIHRVRGELGPDAAARRYGEELHSFFGSPWPVFDLILLGMGSDGHTASLFPGSDALREATQAVVGVTAHYQDRPARRVTLTPPAINAAQQVMFVVTGAEKAETLRRVLAGPYQPDVLPAQVVQPTQGRLLWLVDNKAGSEVEHLA